MEFNLSQTRSIRELVEVIEETESARIVVDYVGLLIYEFIKDKSGFIDAWDKIVNELFDKGGKDEK